jgi:hypothetical protein
MRDRAEEARLAHNQEVVSSNLTPATNWLTPKDVSMGNRMLTEGLTEQNK